MDKKYIKVAEGLLAETKELKPKKKLKNSSSNLLPSTS
jgi:hypothetical protein